MPRDRALPLVQVRAGREALVNPKTAPIPVAPVKEALRKRDHEKPEALHDLALAIADRLPPETTNPLGFIMCGQLVLTDAARGIGMYSALGDEIGSLAEQALPAEAAAVVVAILEGAS